MHVVRRMVPRSIRRGISAQLGRVQALRLYRQLASMAGGTETIVAGPWLGEVGFELLYWAPFLAWFAETFDVAPERVLIVSRGGTARWYAPFAAGYRELFDTMSPEDFRRVHDERVAANGEQKQTQVLAFERDLLRKLAGDIRHRAMLHPSTMYRLFNRFWWGHVGTEWILEHSSYRRLRAPRPPAPVVPAAPYVAVKFYFNDCFPATDENRVFVRSLVRRLSERGPVVSLTTGLSLDDHGGVESQTIESRPLAGRVDARDNLALQSAIVANASAFVGTYGGFSYLAPFHGVPSFGFYRDAGGYSARHLLMARLAFDTIGSGGLLQVQPTTAADPLAPILQALV